jgi:hypothetical protein
MRAVLRQVDRLEADAKAATAGPLRAYLQAQAQALRTKMRNWVSHGHRQFAQFLVDSFDYVFLPKLSIAKLVQRFDEDTDQYRMLNKIATRQLLAWRHGEFHSKVLASKLRFFPGCCVLNINEAYTTKGKQSLVSAIRLFTNPKISSPCPLSLQAATGVSSARRELAAARCSSASHQTVRALRSRVMPMAQLEFASAG